MDSQPVSFLMLCRAEMNVIFKFEIHHRFWILSQSLQGYFSERWTLNVKRRVNLSLVIRVRKLSESGSISGPCTGKTDRKLDLLSLLTLITKLLSHSAYCKIPPQHQREPRQKYIIFSNEKRLKRNVKIDEVNLFSRLNFRISGHWNIPQQ